MAEPKEAGPRRTAFLLAQVGSFVSARFSQRTRAIGLSPGDAGVLRLLGRSPGLSQRVVADRIGAVPSRIVTLIDSLEERGLVERRRSSSDRRNYELHLTKQGQEQLMALRDVAREHEAEVLSALTSEQTAELHDLLGLIAAAHDLDRDLHHHTGR